MSKKEGKITKEKDAVRRFLVPYLNLEKRFPLLPGAQTVEGVASFIGLSVQELVEARAVYDQQAEIAAQEVLKDEDVLTSIEKLPFKKGQKIVALGDSLTDDLQGWFEILRHLVDIARPDLELEWLNYGVYEDTSFDTLRRLNRHILHEKPDWVFVSLGAFDAMRLHAAPYRTVVSLAEFWENINSIENAVSHITKNPVVWITPPPVITELMEKAAIFEGIVSEEDLAQYRDVLSGKGGIIVDPNGKRMGNPPEAWNYLPDGFHPSLPGSSITVKHIIANLVK